jgi:hypothetical protein
LNTEFPPCSQNQGLAKPPLILVAHPWAPQAVFQQPDKARKQFLVCTGGKRESAKMAAALAFLRKAVKLM